MSINTGYQGETGAMGHAKKAVEEARAFKEASVQALRAIGTPQAQQALEKAARTGDRLLRRIIRTTS